MPETLTLPERLRHVALHMELIDADVEPELLREAADEIDRLLRLVGRGEVDRQHR